MTRRIRTTRQARECRAIARERAHRALLIEMLTDALARAAAAASRAQAWLDESEIKGDGE